MAGAIANSENRGALLKRIAEEYEGVDIDGLRAIVQVIDFALVTIRGADAHFARYGLSQGRFGLLMLLHGQPEREWTLADLANALGCRRATVTGLLKLLEGDQLVKRRRNPKDGRSYLISISKTGMEKLAEILPDHFARSSHLLSALKPDEMEQLLGLLQRIRPAMIRRINGED